MVDISSQTLPIQAGTSLKPQHYEEVLGTNPALGWFEVHAENYMGAGGPAHHYLSRIRDLYPLSVHGVGLSIGGATPLDETHLARLKAVVDRYQPALVSEHLAWSSHGGAYYPDLLPLPYTPETLSCVSNHVDRVQEVLGRSVLIENPSTYIVFETSTISETDFLTELAQRTGCGLLLDVTNVYVSATNHGLDPISYIDAFPLPSVGEIHLAGHAVDQGTKERSLLIDAHDGAVSEPVWALYKSVLERIRPTPTLIEWDSNVPSLSTLLAEAEKANFCLATPFGEQSHAALG